MNSRIIVEISLRKPCGSASCVQLFVVSGSHRIISAVCLDSDVLFNPCEGGGGSAQGAGLAGGEAEAAGNAAQDGRPRADGSRHQEARGHHRAIRRPHPQQAGTPAAQGARRLSHSCPPNSFLVGAVHGLGLQVTWQTPSFQGVVLPCPSEIRLVGQSWVWYGSVLLATWQGLLLQERCSPAMWQTPWGIIPGDAEVYRVDS